jgi:hypothetical protein
MQKEPDQGKAADMIGADDEMVDLKTRCVPLLFDCPVRASGKGCPFAEVRDRDVVDRVNWLKAKPAHELRAILKHHSSCMERGQKRA